MFYKSIMIVLLFGATCFGQAAVQTEEQAQAEMQRIREQMQTLQRQLDDVIAQTKALREHAANLAEQQARQPQPPAATAQPTPSPMPSPIAPPDYKPSPNSAQPNNTADQSNNDMQRVISLLEKIDQRQSQLDAKIGVVEARQNVLEQQVDNVSEQQNTTNSNPYAYQPNRNTQPAQTVTVPANQVQTTMVVPRTYVSGYQAPTPVYNVTYASPPTTSVVYTNRYVYPRVWHGSVHVVPSYWRHGHCGYRWPYRYGSYGSRVGFFGGINIRF